MVKVSILVAALYIAVQDLCSHKISNVSNLIFFIVLSLDSHPGAVTLTASIALLSLPLCALFRIGMGDYKLWLSMLLTQAGMILSLRFLNLFTFALLFAFILAAVRGQLRGAIAFGPVLIFPFIVLYLAI
jgi:Flp pilus assembly protein protease CpaA